MYDLDETSETSPPSSSRSYPPDSSKSGRSGKEPTVPHQWHPRFVSYEDWPPDRPLFSTYSSSSSSAASLLASALCQPRRLAERPAALFFVWL